MRKWIVLRMLDFASLFASAFNPDLHLDKVDERLQWWSDVIEVLKRMEYDPIMKRRWELFRRVSLWILSDDGAYRIRWLILLLAIIGSANEINIKSYEIEDILRFLNRMEQSS
jgi:hypothetical protein